MLENLLHPDDNQKIIDRIMELTPNHRALWGKMNATDMLLHCKQGLSQAFGELVTGYSWIPFLLIGKLTKWLSLSKKPFQKNLPTDPSYIMKGDEKDFEVYRNELISYVQRFVSEPEAVSTTNPHPIFGKMTAKEWGRIGWQHINHHLKQFNV